MNCGCGYWSLVPNEIERSIRNAVSERRNAKRQPDSITAGSTTTLVKRRGGPDVPDKSKIRCPVVPGARRDVLQSDGLEQLLSRNTDLDLVLAPQLGGLDNLLVSRFLHAISESRNRQIGDVSWFDVLNDRPIGAPDNKRYAESAAQICE